MKVYNKQIVTNAVMNATINSLPMQLYNMFGYSIQAVWTGTPTGSFKLQGSSEYVEQSNTNGYAPTNWDDIAGSTYAVTAAGSNSWNVDGAMYNWVRLVYTDGSGGASTAVLNAIFNGKGV